MVSMISRLNTIERQSTINERICRGGQTSMDKKMTSLAKIEANRKNAQKSTGPKDISVTHLNALKHGLLSKEVLLKGENDDALIELSRRIRRELAPKGELELILIDRIISSTWRLKRAIGMERCFIQEEYDDCEVDIFGKKKNKDDKTWSLMISRELGECNSWLNLIRYETTIEKQIYKALHELLRLQSSRRGDKLPIPIALDVDISGEH
jgi:hypothetical protein